MASSSSSSSSAPDFSSPSWKYHVFLSFRGEDTRNTFVGHLYSALEQEGIFTYKDDETLPPGESVHPALMKAIEESQIAVIIFSENYGDSSWCLDELLHIMKCRDTRGLIVLPIFYDVGPSEVRKQKRKYGESMAKHELENKTKVESWRKALTDASNISGWEPKHIANGHESKGIKQIVVEISQKLQRVTSSANENLIGMAGRMQCLRSKVQVGSGGVRMIGIWGVGGGGKTTLASSIYDEICTYFDCCCFLHNIREESNRSGLKKLQEDLLIEMGVRRVGGVRCMIKDRLCHRKVLIVLDDVNHLDQLKALAGSHDWFGEGSRIIITTRDEHLLTAHKVNVIHNISLLNNDEAIKLFHKHAPRDNRPMKDYEQLSKEVVSYAGGLPLALTVLGSFLCDKDIITWKSALARLKDIPDTDIVEKLKISFDGLKSVEKELFLEIACFFSGADKTWAMRILDVCGFHPLIGVQVLIQKALITTSEDGTIDMHDLVQEMGHHIVRGEHPNNPEKHSRIWKEEDVLKICLMDAATVMVKLAFLDVFVCVKKHFNNLFILSQELDTIEAIVIQLDNFPSTGNNNLLGHLPPIVANSKNLRLIEWHGDFASHLLKNFPQSKLCCLILAGSMQEKLWEGYKLLPNLKMIQLGRLERLIMIPDFDGLPNLERLLLFRCYSLQEIHPSIGRLERLVHLSIEICDNLKMCPPLTQTKKLETLSITDCPKLFTWLTCCCSNRPRVGCCLEEPCLPYNNMKTCLRDNNMNRIGLRFFFEGLRDLNLGRCNLGDEEIGSANWELPNLEKLNLEDNKFSRLSFSRLRLPRLKYLTVFGCKDLLELSEMPSSIAAVDARLCESLESFGDISKCKWLWKVSFHLGNDRIGDTLLDSILQGNAIEDYFISVTLTQQIPKMFVGRLVSGRTFTMCLPDNWYNDFCGYLICVVMKSALDIINIVIKQEVDEEDSLFEFSFGSSEVVEPEIADIKMTCVGYVSFGSLRHSACSNSSYTRTSISLDCNSDVLDYYFGVELVPRKSKGDEVQTTKVTADYSEFWDHDRDGESPTFRMDYDSKSSVKIVWSQLTTVDSEFWDQERDGRRSAFRVEHNSKSSIKIVLRPLYTCNVTWIIKVNTSMASSSSSLSAPAFSSTSWKYHVFLSFRGDDTRNTFADHLYSALEQRGIFTYKDDETLPRGESVHPSLMKAIEESQIAVIIFSENYGDSSWCLDELAHIMKCRDTRGQIVLPVFYDVDPSVVRKQKRKYGEAMAKHELENRTKVESWRKALTDASNISGWEPKHIANGHESKGIKQIVIEISQKLLPVTSSANENLIGMAVRMQRLRSELQVGTGGVVMIGIWGVGGGGKTTLASSIYDEVSKQFDCCCFLQNIRDESNKHGLGKLEDDLLSNMGVRRVGGGRFMIKDRLCRKKVLIVLDDVDRLDQLKALAGSHDWFGDGSRIIVTTRDEHILTAQKVNVIHHISLLNDDEAIKLFHKQAPKDNRPVKEYEQLSKEVVSYAGGLPLALTVLGSFLCDKDITMWKSALARLKDIPDTDIVGKLKISFDGLKMVEKELFLDIACFFRRKNKKLAMKILDACGFHPVIGVQVLIQKALITVLSNGEFDMHDLLQEMGHDIVRGGHPNSPEKHSRIWKEEDLLTICAMDATTELDTIEAIQLSYDTDSPRNNQLQHLPPIAANTKNLRWIDWKGDFSSHLLKNFPQRKLCCLILKDSLQEQLWEGYKWLPNLKIMELWGVEQLVMTPDFDGLPNLEILSLTRCLYLEEIHPSIQRLERLVSLTIEFCNRLKTCPPITQPKKLQTLSFSHCPMLGRIHLDDDEGKVASNRDSMTNSLGTWLTCLRSNHPGVEQPCLEEPCLRDNNMNPCFGLRYFLEGLRDLNLGWCRLGNEVIGTADWELPNLEELNLEYNKFSRLSFSRLRLPRLKFLNVRGCRGLVELLELPSSIFVVNADWCNSLQSFGDISKCKWLWKVSNVWGNNLIGETLLDSILQGNAIEDYFLSVTLMCIQIPKKLVRWRPWGRTFTLPLPYNWYNDFCGFLICVVTENSNLDIKIDINNEQYLVEYSYGLNKKRSPEFVDKTKTFVGYVSFGSLRHITFSNSSYTKISVSVEHFKYLAPDELNYYLGAELVSRKSKDDEVQTKTPTYSSEFWDGERDGRRPTFRIQRDSISSINILWRPL
ncbi:hypothetical protein LXL04_025723 [Taraxacum kok-saghyz]